MESSYDVIIVGGRPAGSGLAHRLGQQGRKVLVLERQHLPSLPHVPSSAIVHMGTVALLDEIGIPEDAIAAVSLRTSDYLLRFGTWFDAAIPFPEVHGRAHGYGIVRSAFDEVLFRQLDKWPTVTRREGFAVEGLIHDEAGRVIGVEGKGDDGPARYTARWVVGADGRFSSIARMAGAKVREQRDEKASTVYLANWEGIAPRFAGAPTAFEVYTDASGTDLIFLPTPGGRTILTTHQRADRVDIGGDAEGYYRAQVARYPWYRERFAEAKIVDRVVGLKKVGNGYREAAGRGWALVGDAFHFKDPVDGQGIYDALLCGRFLAEELGAALDGKKSDDEAAARYGERADAATHPMFEATLERLKMELYGPTPNLPIRTLLRWWLQDPAYGERLIRFLSRDPTVDPTNWRPPGFLIAAALRGLGRDIAGMFGRKALPGPKPVV